MRIQAQLIIGISKVVQDGRLAFYVTGQFKCLQGLLKIADVTGNIHTHSRKRNEGIANAILIAGLLAERQGILKGASGLFGLAKDVMGTA